MAKKSAMSKGYRKTAKKKPFLTKKEIIALVVIVAAILLGILLFNLFYDDGFMDAGEVQQGDIVSYASSDLRDRYAKIGEIGAIEGFTLEERTEDASPIETYTFNPDAETGDNVSYVTVSGSFVNAATLAATNISYMDSALGYNTEIHETTIQDHPAYVFGYTYSEYVEDEAAAEAAAETEPAAETEEEPADNKFSQNLSAYVEVDDSHTLCLHVYLTGSDDSFYIPDDQIVDYIQKYTTAFNLNVEEEA